MATDARDLKIDVVAGSPLETSAPLEKAAAVVDRRRPHVADAEQYLRTALPAISRILASVDRNPFSPSYGCCDRQYWHYRTASFASEMYQEAALPLALAYTKRYPTSDWFGETRLAETAVAILRFSAKNAHPDGSADDYYPQERALGAAVFSLQAATETYRLLELDDAALLKFFTRRAEWIAANDESGRLTNHHALSALALWRTAKLTGSTDFEQAAIERLERVVAWQSPEGWFPEYEGADPGYQTVTIDCLAKFRREPGMDWLAEPLRKAVAFCRWFQHPDDSYSGPYASRGTRHLYPHGLELLATELPEAAALTDGYLRALASHTAADFDDDRMYVHRVAGLLEAYEARTARKSFSPGELNGIIRLPANVAEGRMRDAVQAESGPSESEPSTDGDMSLIRLRVRSHLLPKGEGFTTRPQQKHFHAAGLYITRDAQSHTIVSTARGGVFAHYTADQSHTVQSHTDAGLVVEFDDGRLAVSQTHDLTTTVELSHLGESEAIRELTAVRMLSYVRCERATPFKQAALHLVMGAIGKRGRTWMRKLLQRRVIAGGMSAPVRMTRAIEFLPAAAQHEGRRLRVTDTMELADPKTQVVRFAFASDLQAAYTAAAEVYQRSLRQPWQDLTARAAEWNAARRITIVREF
jgi:hypothetical protein